MTHKIEVHVPSPDDDDDDDDDGAGKRKADTPLWWLRASKAPSRGTKRQRIVVVGAGRGSLCDARSGWKKGWPCVYVVYVGMRARSVNQ